MSAQSVGSVKPDGLADEAKAKEACQVDARV